MGREIVRVPPDFKHPVDEQGEFIVGAHLEPLYYSDPASRRSYQLYENVSEGSPVSPVFDTAVELIAWLKQEGYEQEAITFLLGLGHVPSLTIRT